MSLETITEGIHNIMKRDAMVAGTDFLPESQPYAKDDVVQRILAKKGGSKPEPIRIPEVQPRPEFGDETPPTLQTPALQFNPRPSQGFAIENRRATVPNLTQLAINRGEKVSGGKTRKNTTTGGDIVTALLTIRNQIKLYHWQTTSFADHKATDDLTAALDTAIDTFVEVYMGKYGRPRVSKAMKLHNFSANMAREFVTKQTVYLLNVLPRKLKKTDTDLLNIRDEILAELNKTRYLFTLS